MGHFLPYMLALHLGYFCVGALTGPRLVGWFDRGHDAALLGVVVFGLALYSLAIRPFSPWPGSLLVPAFTGLVPLAVLLSASLVISRRWPRSWVGYAGAHSMDIYVFHVIAAAAVRIALFHLGIRLIPVHLALGVLVGVLAPLALDAATTRCGLPSPFRLRLPQRPVDAT
jgi:hypothetical protein